MRYSWSSRVQCNLVGLALIAGLALSVSGCVIPGADGQVGAGLPQLHGNEKVAGASTAFKGTVEVGSDGCMRVQVTSPAEDTTARWAVWPSGTELYAPDAPEPSEARTHARVGKELFSDQDRVSGTAQLVTLAALPDGDSSGSYFAGAGGYCHAQDSGVIVIAEIKKV